MKRKLLLMAVALLCAIVGRAQTWTAGAVAADEGEYYLYNIGAQRFLNRGGTYTTHAIADGQGVVVKLDEKSSNVFSIYTGVNSKYLNGDYTDGGELNWTFESVSVDGYTNVYTLKDGTESKYLYWTGGGSGFWGNEVLRSATITEGQENNFYWILIPKATRQNLASASSASPLDITYLVINPDFEYQIQDDPWKNDDTMKPWTGDWGKKTQGWTNTNFWRQQSSQTFANGIFFEKYSDSAQGLSDADKIYQNVTLEAGKYRLTCTGLSENHTQFYLYAGDQETNITSADTYAVDFEVSASGSVEIGTKIKAGSTGKWVAFDNVRLYCVDPYISVIATDFSSGSEMAAGQWYKFTVDAAGDYGFDVIDGVVLTSNGSQTLSEATGDALSHVVTLSTGTTYYIKSTTAQTVTKSDKFTYTIGTGASDKSYIQAGNTVTISYASMTTTNTYTEELDTEISGVTFGGNAISVSRTTKGFTFTVPTVTAGTDYTLAIPAGVIGYKATGSGSNAAQNITLKTPAILDGVYFLKANSTWNGSTRSVTAACGKYLARGNAHGTCATIDKYGLPIAIVTDENNKSTLSPQDTRKYYYHNSNWDCWADRPEADNDVAKYNITLHDGEYRLHSISQSAGKYFKYNDSNVNSAIISLADDGNGTNHGPIINWTFETPTEHATYLQGLKNTQAATAATAANAAGMTSLSGISSMSVLASKLASDEYDKTSIVPSGDISSVEEKFEGSEPGLGNTGEIVYSNPVSITEPGLYKFSLQAFYRAASNSVTQTMHTNGYDFPPVVVFFGSAETQIKSLYDETGLDSFVDADNVSYNGKKYANNMATALEMFQAGLYNNEVYLYVSEAGTYNYGVRYQGYANSNSQWFIYTPQSVSVTKFSEADAEPSDKAALLAAINGKVLGFENGEYAPYNNVDAVGVLNDAQDVYDDASAKRWEVNAAIDAINDATWTANDIELNAFCGGNFSQYQTVYNSGDSRNEDYPYGWNLYHGDKNRSRIMGGTEGSSNTGLSASSSGKALLLKFNATYGESEGYTMPLKAATLYKITFKHGRWAEGNPRVTDVVMTDPDGASITLAPGFQAETNDCQSNSGNWYTYTGYFVSTKAGDYKFNLTKRGSNSQMQIAIADIDLRTASEIEFADGSVPTYAPGTYPSVKITRTLTANKWATAVYPFAVSGVDNIAVLESYNKATGALGFKTATASEANVPFLMRSTAGATDITLSNVEVAAAAATDATASEASLKGAYTVTEINNSALNFVLSSNVIYPVGAAGATISPYRAYIQIAQQEEVKALSFFVDDTETAIEGINEENKVEGPVYNLAGQRVNKAQRGIYIVNGKKVLVK